MKKRFYVLMFLLALLGPTPVGAYDGPTCGFHRMYTPIMTKDQAVLRIDDGNPSDFVGDSIERVADNQAPPAPTGFSVEDALGGVVLHVAQETDTSHLVKDFKEYVVYRAEEVDGSATPSPVGVLELDRFSGSRHFISGVAGTHYKYALKARDKSGNFSAYSDWKLGIALRDNGIFDRFDGYGGSSAVAGDSDLFWRMIESFEDSSEWTPGSNTAVSNQTTNTIEGTNMVRITRSGGGSGVVTASKTFAAALDLSAEGRFGTDDYITTFIYSGVASSDNFNIQLRTDASNYFFQAHNADPGANHVLITRGSFSSSGSPDWSNITSILIESQAAIAVNEYVEFDDYRIVKASTLDATTYSDTGDTWTPLADDNQANSPGQWHVYQDMPGQPFALGQVDITDSAERYIIPRQDRPQADAVHACAMQIKYADGQAGMLFRVRQPPVVAETPVINVLFTNSSTEAVGQTDADSASGVSFGTDTTYGAYGSFGASDTLSYSSVTIGNSRNQTTVHAAIRPDFAASAGGDKTIFHHFDDASNNMELFYDASNDAWRLAVEVAGSTTNIDSATQTFSADTNMTVTAVLDGTTARLYVNGVLSGSGTISGNYTTGSGTFYVSSDQASGQDFTGRIYQVLANAEANVAAELLEWYNALFNPSGVRGSKVGSPISRSYYSVELNSTNNTVELNEYRVGFNPVTHATVDADTDDIGISSIDVDAVYQIAVIFENQDNNNDGNADQVLIKAYVATDPNKLLDGDSQVIADTLTDATDQPFYSGWVGFVTDAAIVRFANFRAGSPARAEEAERAVVARVAKKLEAGDGTDEDVPLIEIDVTGSPALTWDESEDGIALSDGHRFITDEVRARDAAGLKLFEDGGAGIFVENGGNVGISTTSPASTARLHVVPGGDTHVGLQIDFASATGRAQMRLADELGAEIWRFGVTAGGGANFAFFDGTQDAFVLFQNGRGYFNGNGNFGIRTTVPGQILDVNQGGGNMIADGYDSHSLAEYKEEITDAPPALASLRQAQPKRWRRRPHVSADELRAHAILTHLAEWIEEFGGEVVDGALTGDDYRGDKLRNIKNAELKAVVDAEAQRLRAERRLLPRWQRRYHGLVADEQIVIDNMPDVLARGDDGEVSGINLDNYIGKLHQGLIESHQIIADLRNRVRALEQA